MNRPVILTLLFVGFAYPWPVVTTEESRPSSGSQRVTFQPEVANIEYAKVAFVRSRPPTVRKIHELAGEAWYGSIMRRLAGDGPWDSSHYVPFAVTYAGGVATQAWCDTNFNGDLTDDPPTQLSVHPSREGARSFLTDLRWSRRVGSGNVLVDWKIRIVLEPALETAILPFYRVQRVFAMVGTITMEGKPHRAFLFDGSGDGVYTKSFSDGLFVDLDDDLHFEIDQFAEGFGPFAVPFQMEGHVYEVESVDPEGRESTLTERGLAKPVEPPKVGKMAPDFAYLDLTGRTVRLADYKGRVVLVYFWASWCGNCESQAPAIAEIRQRYGRSGLEVLGVSYDTDGAAMNAFRSRHGYTWPTSFTGRMLWEDPVGRVYRAQGPGVVYLVDREGRLDGIYNDIQGLAARLAALLPSTTTLSQ